MLVDREINILSKKDVNKYIREIERTNKMDAMMRSFGSPMGETGSKGYSMTMGQMMEYLKSVKK
ncbi:MAG: hypothetical protein AAB532_01905 [Patescibacteria group bacterium]